MVYGLSAQHEVRIDGVKKDVTANVVWIKESLLRGEAQQQRIDEKVDRMITGRLNSPFAGDRATSYYRFLPPGVVLGLTLCCPS